MIDGGLKKISPISIAPTENRTGSKKGSENHLETTSDQNSGNATFVKDLKQAENIAKKPGLKAEVNVQKKARNNVNANNTSMTEGSSIGSRNKMNLSVLEDYNPMLGKAFLEEDRIQNKVLAEEFEVKPMLKFLDSMERELGVEPQKVVVAMSQLTDTQLLEPPTSTMDDMLENLDLDPWQEQRAGELYATMLTELQLVSSAQKASQAVSVLPAKDPFLHSQDFLSVKNQAFVSDKPMSLNEKIEQMNKRFFEVYPEQRFGRTPMNPKEVQLLVSSQQAVAPKEFFNAAVNNGQLDISEMEMVDSTTYQMAKEQSTDQEALAVKSIENNTISQEQEQNNSNHALLAKLSALVASTGSVEKSMQPNNGGSGQNLMQQNKNNPVLQNIEEGDALNLKSSGDLLNEFKALNIQSAEAKSANQIHTNKVLDPIEGEAGDSLLSQNSILNQVPKTSSKVIVPTAATSLGSSINNDANADEIVRNTQVLANKGGGEMKMQLRPEGLGEIQLKVAVNDGKVDVQMLTDNQMAKRALQSDLNALKTGLNDSQLDLQTIKVDSSDGMSKFLEDQMNEQQRQQARQFLEEFREGNFSDRSGFAHDRGFKSYGNDGRSEEVEELLLPKKSVKTSSRRLDVVA